MRLSASQMLPPRQVLRKLVTDIAWGLAVRRVFEDLDGRSHYMAALLPTSTKVLSETKTGERLVDVFLTWSDGPVVAAPVHGSVDTSWSFVEHGKKVSGTVTLTAHEASGIIDVSESYPAHAAPLTAVVLLGTRRFERLILKLERMAAESEWTLVSELERYVLFSLEAANRRVAREIEGDSEDTELTDYYADRDNHGVLDRIALDKIAGTLLYGADGTPASSVIRRLIVRCATTSINQQPLSSYLATNVYSQAELHIRREIGDPHVGRKVRRLARESGAPDIDSLLAAYRVAHPKDELGLRRAIAALTAGKSVESTATSMSRWLGGNP